MAQYRLSVRIISRSQRKGGRSVVAAAAYRACKNLKDTKYGLTHYYARKQGNVFHTMFGVADGPQWAREPEGFWNAVEKAEDGHNRSASAQLARELQLNIPVELDGLQGRTLFTKWIREVLEPLGMSGQGDLHADEKGKNPHGHILICFRELTENGFAEEKNREWNHKKLLNALRDSWEQYCNAALQEAGSAARVTHLSYAKQGIDKMAGIHFGPDAWAMHQAGLATRQWERQKAVFAQNRAREMMGQEAPILHDNERAPEYAEKLKREERRNEYRTRKPKRRRPIVEVEVDMEAPETFAAREHMRRAEQPEPEPDGKQVRPLPDKWTGMPAKEERDLGLRRPAETWAERERRRRKKKEMELSPEEQ